MPTGRFLVWILVAYGVSSAVSYAVWAFDKHRARQGGRRVPEKTLHTLALAGGWPGALLARSRLRHKTRKRGFSTVLYGIAGLHVALWVWLLSGTPPL